MRGSRASRFYDEPNVDWGLDTFFEKLRVDTTGRKILVSLASPVWSWMSLLTKLQLTEPPANPLKNRETMCQVMFELVALLTSFHTHDLRS